MKIFYLFFFNHGVISVKIFIFWYREKRNGMDFIKRKGKKQKARKEI